MPPGPKIKHQQVGDRQIDTGNFNNMADAARKAYQYKFDQKFFQQFTSGDGGEFITLRQNDDDLEMFDLEASSKPDGENDQIRMVPGIMLRGGKVAWTSDAKFLTDPTAPFTDDFDFIGSLTLTLDDEKVFVYAVLNDVNDMTAISGSLDFSIKGATWADTTNGKLGIIFKKDPFSNPVGESFSPDPFEQTKLIAEILLHKNDAGFYHIEEIRQMHHGIITNNVAWNSSNRLDPDDHPLRIEFGFTSATKPFFNAQVLANIKATFATPDHRAPSKRNKTEVSVSDVALDNAAQLQRQFHYLALENPATADWETDPSLIPTDIGVFHQASAIDHNGADDFTSWFRLIYETKNVTDNDGHKIYQYRIYPTNWFTEDFWMRPDGIDVNETGGRASLNIDGALGKVPSRLQTLDYNTVTSKAHLGELQFGQAYEKLVNSDTITQFTGDFAITYTAYSKNPPDSGDSTQEYARLDTHDGLQWQPSTPFPFTESIEVHDTGGSAVGKIVQLHGFYQTVGGAKLAKDVHGMAVSVTKGDTGLSKASIDYAHIVQLDPIGGSVNPRIDVNLGGLDPGSFLIVQGFVAGGGSTIQARTGQAVVSNGRVVFEELSNTTALPVLLNIHISDVPVTNIQHTLLLYNVGSVSALKSSNIDHDGRFWPAFAIDNTEDMAAQSGVSKKSYHTTGEVHADDLIIQDRIANSWNAEDLVVDVTTDIRLIAVSNMFINTGGTLNLSPTGNIFINTVATISSGNFAKGLMTSQVTLPALITIAGSGIAQDNISRNKINDILASLALAGIGV